MPRDRRPQLDVHHLPGNHRQADLHRLVHQREIYGSGRPRDDAESPHYSEHNSRTTVWTIRKKSGEERSFTAKPGAPLSHDNNVKRYNRMADFMEIDRAQADRAREQWMNLSDCEGHRSSHADHCEIWQAQALVRQKPRPLGLTDKNSTQTMFF